MFSLTSHPCAQGEVRHLNLNPCAQGEVRHLNLNPCAQGEVRHLNLNPCAQGEVRHLSLNPCAQGEVRHLSLNPCAQGEVRHLNLNPKTEHSTYNYFSNANKLRPTENISPFPCKHRQEDLNYKQNTETFHKNITRYITLDYRMPQNDDVH